MSVHGFVLHLDIMAVSLLGAAAPEVLVLFMVTAHGGDWRDDYRLLFSGSVDARLSVRQAFNRLLRNRSVLSFTNLADRLLIQHLLRSSTNTTCKIGPNMVPLDWQTVVGTINALTIYVDVEFDEHSSDSSHNSDASM